MTRGIVLTGIFSALVIAAIIPQSALSQSVPTTGTNVSSAGIGTNVSSAGIGTNVSSAGINSHPDESSKTPVPKLLLDPANRLIIHDPGGDDIFTKDCLYLGEAYSPGAVLDMVSDVRKTCGSDGEWH
jgi:hypothetical protein